MRSVWTRPRVLTGAAAAAAGPVPSDSISLSLMFAPPLFFKKWEEKKHICVIEILLCRPDQAAKENSFFIFSGVFTKPYPFTWFPCSNSSTRVFSNTEAQDLA